MTLKVEWMCINIITMLIHYTEQHKKWPNFVL